MPTSIPPRQSNEPGCSLPKPIGVRFVEWILGPKRPKENPGNPSVTTTTGPGESGGCCVTPAIRDLSAGAGNLNSFSKPTDILNVRRLSGYRLYCDRCYGLVGWVFGWGFYCKRCEIMYNATGPTPCRKEELKRYGYWLKEAVKRGTLAPM